MKNCHQYFAFSKTSKQKSTKTIGHLFFIELWATSADKAVFYYNNVFINNEPGKVKKNTRSTTFTEYLVRHPVLLIPFVDIFEDLSMI